MTTPILEQIPIGAITTGDNVRSDLGDLEELTASIKAVGILEPVVVTRNGKRYELVLGHRRLKAAKKAGLQSVPAVVRDVAPEARTELQLIENLHRADLPPLDEARAYQRLVDEYGYSQREIADAVGRAQSHVAKRLALLALPPPAAKALDSGKINIQEAQELTKLADDPDRVARALQEAARNRTWQGPRAMAQAVDTEVQARDTDRRFAELEEKAKAGKAPYLEAGSPYHRAHSGLPNGARKLEGWHNGLQMDAAGRRAHRKEDCHAVTVLVDYDGVRLVEICTKPGKHQAKPRKSAAETKAEKERQALLAAGKSRRVFVVRALEKAPTRQEAFPLIITELIRASHQSVLKEACSFLGVEPVRTKSKYGDGDHIDYAGPLQQLAATTERAALRVGLGIFAAAGEESAGSWWGRGVHDYFRWLRSRRYRPSEIERAKLAKNRDEDD